MYRKAAILPGFAIAVRALRGALIGIGQQFFSMDTTMILHAIGAPPSSAVFAALYFCTTFATPLVTAAAFVGGSLLLKDFVVAMLIENSFEMLAGVLGVWIPQVLIFSPAYLTGRLMVPAREKSG